MNYLLLVKLDDDLDENIKEYYKNYKLAHEGDAELILFVLLNN